jgi:GT2 family glycosyltransferase
VVASHARRLRLRWLLNALEEQTCERAWEVIVVHDYDAETARRVIEDHPLTRAGRLSHLAIEPGTGSPSRQRNIGWRAARAPLIAFTDDDCRPEPGWLAGLLAETDGAETTVVQGRTRPDPFERAVLDAPHVRTLDIDPVNPYRQTCNMLYPRALLERLGGFDELAVSGEDVGLSLRAEAAGAAIVAAPEAIVNHAIESHTLPGIMRQNLKWRHLAYLVKTHPEFRRELTAGLFWDREHLLVSLALAGLAAARRDRRALLLTAPFLVRAMRRRGRRPAALALAGAELPGLALRQSAEVAGLAAGSVRHRTVVL